MTTLTMKEEKRTEVIQRVFRGELTVGEAAMILALSERQCYRIKARVNEQGANGVVIFPAALVASGVSASAVYSLPSFAAAFLVVR